MSAMTELSTKPSHQAPARLDRVLTTKPTSGIERLRETFLSGEKGCAAGM